MDGWVADDTCPAINFGFSGFELWFDQCNNPWDGSLMYCFLRLRGHYVVYEGGQYQAQRDEGDIDDDALDGFRQGCQVADIGVFHDHDARIIAQRPGKLSMTNVDSIDAQGTAFEQAMGEAAR